MAGDGKTYFANGYFADNYWNQYYWFDNSTGGGAAPSTSTGLRPVSGAAWMIVHSRSVGF